MLAWLRTVTADTNSERAERLSDKLSKDSDALHTMTAASLRAALRFWCEGQGLTAEHGRDQFLIEQLAGQLTLPQGLFEQLGLACFFKSSCRTTALLLVERLTTGSNSNSGVPRRYSSPSSALGHRLVTTRKAHTN